MLCGVGLEANLLFLAEALVLELVPDLLEPALPEAALLDLEWAADLPAGCFALAAVFDLLGVEDAVCAEAQSGRMSASIRLAAPA